MGEEINGDPTGLPWQRKPSQTPTRLGEKETKGSRGLQSHPRPHYHPTPGPSTRGAAPPRAGPPPPRSPCSAGGASGGPQSPAANRGAYTEGLLCSRPRVSSSDDGNPGKHFSSAPECLFAKELSNQTARTISVKPYSKRVREGRTQSLCSRGLGARARHVVGSRESPSLSPSPVIGPRVSHSLAWGRGGARGNHLTSRGLQSPARVNC